MIDKLVEECSENIEGNEIIYNGTLGDYGKICYSCTVYIVLLVIFFLISVSISNVFIYFHWYLKRRYIEVINYFTYKWEMSKKQTLKIEHITFLMR